MPAWNRINITRTTILLCHYTTSTAAASFLPHSTTSRFSPSTCSITALALAADNNSKSKMPKPRPGVPAAVRLSKIHDHQVWTEIESHYPEMLALKHKDLTRLDQFCDQLANKWKNQKSKATKPNASSITKDELIQVIEWKFAKGKARPMLWKQIQSNAEAAVQEASCRAFEIVDQLPTQQQPSSSSSTTTTTTTITAIIKQAVEALSSKDLKGIGPATASAVLSLYRPDLFAFMDDEVLEGFVGERKYTLKAYLDMNEECLACARRLGDGWTPRRVGTALWTAARLSLCEDRVDLTVSTASKGGKEDKGKKKEKDATKTEKDAKKRQSSSSPSKKSKDEKADNGGKDVRRSKRRKT